MTSVTLQSVSLEVERLLPGPPTQGSYPYPSLTGTGELTPHEFEAIVLDNSFLRAWVLPELGGRLIRLLDKRTGVEIVPQRALRATARGFRGVEIAGGLRWGLHGPRERRSATGRCLFQIDEETGSAWLFEIAAPEGIGQTARWILPENEAELRFELRAHNRTLAAQPYDPVLIVPASGDAFLLEGGCGAYDSERQAGVAVWQDDEPLDSFWHTPGALHVARFAHGTSKFLAPRQLDVWTATIQPLSGLTRLDGLGRRVAIELGTEVRLQASSPIEGAKLFVHTEDGQTLEAPVDLDPEAIVRLTPPSAAVAAALRDSGKTEVVRTGPFEKLTQWSAIAADTAPPSVLPDGLPELALKRATFEVDLRFQAHLALARLYARSGDFASAAVRLESALLFNAEDGLAWRMKAACERRLSPEGERPELINAHYLSPLEPTLRAEALLGQPMQEGSAPSPLLSALAEVPELLIEVACALIEDGLTQDAVRWIEEALRHADLPMLRYLLADAHLAVDPNGFEAAKELTLAGKAEVQPPFPWRPAELGALSRLSARFPEDASLKTWLAASKLLNPNT